MQWKLVRDNIPEIVRQSGGQPVFRVLDESDRLVWLIRKLAEESEELSNSPCLEECADVLEVLLAIARQLGYSDEQLKLAAVEKARLRGAFDGGILLQVAGGGE